MNYKIREALQDKKIPYVAVVGDREVENCTLALRARARGAVGVFGFEDFLTKLNEEIKAKTSVPSISE